MLLSYIHAGAAESPSSNYDSLGCIALTAAADGEFEPLLNTDEAAALVRCHPKSLQAMARAGTVPCFRRGKQWWYRKSSLDEWIAGQLNCNHQSRRVD